MIIIAGLVLGAAIGARNAARRAGNRLDIVQYAAVGGVVGALLGTIGTIALERML
jgi:hypothetical protein